MTNLQEAKLAREAEICYVTLALVTDYDCWHPDHDSVTVEMIVQTLMQNAETAQRAIAEAITTAARRALVRLRLGAEVRAHHAARGRFRRRSRRTSRPSSANTFHEPHSCRRLRRVRFHQDAVRRSEPRRRRRRHVLRDRRVVLHRGAHRRGRRRRLRRRTSRRCSAGGRIDLAGPREGAGRDVSLEGRIRLRPEQPRDDLHAPERLREVHAEDSASATRRRRSSSSATSIRRCRSTC